MALQKPLSLADLIKRRRAADISTSKQDDPSCTIEQLTPDSTPRSFLQLCKDTATSKNGVPSLETILGGLHLSTNDSLTPTSNRPDPDKKNQNDSVRTLADILRLSCVTELPTSSLSTPPNNASFLPYNGHQDVQSAASVFHVQRHVAALTRRYVQFYSDMRPQRLHRFAKQLAVGEERRRRLENRRRSCFIGRTSFTGTDAGATRTPGEPNSENLFDFDPIAELDHDVVRVRVDDEAPHMWQETTASVPTSANAALHELDARRAYLPVDHKAAKRRANQKRKF